MLSSVYLVRAALTVLAAILLAGLWYSGFTTVLQTPSAQMIGTIGAVIIAAGAPVILMSVWFRRQLRHIVDPLEQKLQALDAHSVVSTVDGKGRIVSVNDKMTALSGRSRDALIGSPVSTLYPESEVDLPKRIRARLKAGQTWHGETPLRHADGSTFYTQTTIIPLSDTKGGWNGSISVRTDITSMKQLRSEQKTMEVLDELRDDIWIVNSSDWQLNYMNNAARQRLGYLGQPAEGKKLEHLIEQTDFEPIGLACRALNGSTESASRFEIVHDGVPLHVSVKFVNDAKGSGFFLIVMSDISDRVAQDRKKSEFVATVSHELRSPLTSIKGALSLLLSAKDTQISDKARDLMAIAHRNSDRLILIINDILDLEKISSGEMQMQLQDVDLSEIICEARHATAMIEKLSNVNIEVSGTAKPLPIQTDPNRLIQVLTNLLSNACKFAGESGRVRLSLKDEGDHVRISVEDEGPGIPVSEQHMIFQRFADMTNSDRAAKGGTGLGLSICKAIVESLGGTIGFQSREGVGTEFFFTLPRNQPEADISQISQLQSKPVERHV